MRSHAGRKAGRGASSGGDGDGDDGRDGDEGAAGSSIEEEGAPDSAALGALDMPSGACTLDGEPGPTKMMNIISDRRIVGGEPNLSTSRDALYLSHLIPRCSGSAEAVSRQRIALGAERVPQANAR